MSTFATVTNESRRFGGTELSSLHRLVFGQSDIVNLRTGWCLVPEQLPTYSAYATVVSTLPLPPVASTPPPISSSNAAILS